MYDAGCKITSWFLNTFGFMDSYKTTLQNNISFDVFDIIKSSTSIDPDLLTEIVNSFPIQFAISGTTAGDLIIAMDFMQGINPSDQSFVSIVPPAPTNSTFDYLGFACPYYAFQAGPFSKWTENKPTGDLQALVLDKMYEYSTKSIRISIPWIDLSSCFILNPSSYSQLEGNALEIAVNALLERNDLWIECDSIIEMASRLGFDVIPQITQQESDVAKYNDKTVVPDSAPEGTEIQDRIEADKKFFVVSANTYLYNLKVFAHAAVRRYRNKISLWAIEAELNAAKYAELIDNTRHGNLWEDENQNGFQDKLWRVLVDAVRQEDPSARLTTALHMIKMVNGLQRFASDLEIVGVNIYPNSYFAIPVMGFAVGEMVWATRRALMGLGLNNNSDGTQKEIHITETNYPAKIQSDPPSNISLTDDVTYFSWGRQSQYMNEALESSLAKGATGFFWWGFLDNDIAGNSDVQTYNDYGSLIVRNTNLQFKSAATTFRDQVSTKHPGKTPITLANRSTSNPNLGGLVALTAERDSLISDSNLVYVTKSRNHTSQTYQQILQGIKHQTWDQDRSQPHLKQVFSPLVIITRRDAYFHGTYPASFNISLLEVGSLNGTLSYQDPWWVDATGNQSNTFRNITLAPNFSDNIFLSQLIEPGKPYYSVSASQMQTMTVNGQTYTGVFQNWLGTNANLGNDASLQTAVVFNSSNATVTALYKAHLATTVAAVTASNSQRKVVMDPAGVYHAVYESANKIWYTYSTDGTNWSPESLVSGQWDYQDVHNHNPSISYYRPDPNLFVFKPFVTWECRAMDNSAYHIVVMQMVSDGSWIDIQTSADYTSTVIANPVAAYPFIFYRGPDGIYWMQSFGYLSTPAKIAGTDTYAKDPSAIVNGSLVHIVWEQGGDIKYCNVQTNGSVSSTETIMYVDEFENNCEPCIGIDNTGRQWITWRYTNAETQTEAIKTRMRDAANSYGAVSVFHVNGNSGAHHRPSIAGSRTHGNAVSVAWDINNNATLMKATYADGSWSGMASIASNAVGAQLPMNDDAQYHSSRLVLYTGTQGTLYRLQNTSITEPVNEGGQGGGELDKSSGRKQLAGHQMRFSLKQNAYRYMVEIEAQNGLSVIWPTPPDTIPMMTLAQMAPYLESEPFTLADNSTLDVCVSAMEQGEKNKKNAGCVLELVRTGTKNVLASMPLNAGSGKIGHIDVGHTGNLSAFLRLKLSQNVADSLSFALENCYTVEQDSTVIIAKEESSERTVTFPDLIPRETHLSQNYPNPFNPSTTISYSLATTSYTSLRIYDVLGREVVVLADGMMEAGYYTATFNASRFASGIYFTRFTATSLDGDKPFSQTMKMLLTK